MSDLWNSTAYAMAVVIVWLWRDAWLYFSILCAVSLSFNTLLYLKLRNR